LAVTSALKSRLSPLLVEWRLAQSKVPGPISDYLDRTPTMVAPTTITRRTSIQKNWTCTPAEDIEPLNQHLHYCFLYPAWKVRLPPGKYIIVLFIVRLHWRPLSDKPAVALWDMPMGGENVVHRGRAEVSGAQPKRRF
jgi:hypothetical protein